MANAYPGINNTMIGLAYMFFHLHFASHNTALNSNNCLVMGSVILYSVCAIIVSGEQGGSYLHSLQLSIQTMLKFPTN